MTELRMKGGLGPLAVSAIIATGPLVYAAYERWGRGAPIAGILLVLCGVVALMPWLSRVVGRMTYRAAIDDLALHVGGEALLFKTITQVTERRNWRRTWLVLKRGRVLRVDLVTRDLFAGRLEPIDELMKRLPTTPGDA
jgi:hypothetical protein